MIRLAVTLIAILLAIIAAEHFGLLDKPSYFYETMILLTAVTLGLYNTLLRVYEERPSHFIQFYLASLVVKMIGYAAYILIVMWMDPAAAAANALFFMILYFLFTGLEVLFLYRKINR